MSGVTDCDYAPPEWAVPWCKGDYETENVLWAWAVADGAESLVLGEIGSLQLMPDPIGFIEPWEALLSMRLAGWWEAA